MLYSFLGKKATNPQKGGKIVQKGEKRRHFCQQFSKSEKNFWSPFLGARLNHLVTMA